MIVRKFSRLKIYRDNRYQRGASRQMITQYGIIANCRNHKNHQSGSGDKNKNSLNKKYNRLNSRKITMGIQNQQSNKNKVGRAKVIKKCAQSVSSLKLYQLHMQISVKLITQSTETLRRVSLKSEQTCIELKNRNTQKFMQRKAENQLNGPKFQCLKKKRRRRQYKS